MYRVEILLISLDNVYLIIKINDSKVKNQPDMNLLLFNNIFLAREGFGT